MDDKAKKTILNTEKVDNQVPDTNIAENIARTSGEAEIPDPSDVPGGPYDLGEDIQASTREAVVERAVGQDVDRERKDLAKTGQKTTIPEERRLENADEMVKEDLD